MIRKRLNLDRRNPAGGIAEGLRTVRKGGWIKFGDDYFYAKALENLVGVRVWVNDLEDAFSPLYAKCLPEGDPRWIQIDNLYHLNLRNELPEHLRHLAGKLK